MLSSGSIGACLDMLQLATSLAYFIVGFSKLPRYTKVQSFEVAYNQPGSVME